MLLDEFLSVPNDPVRYRIEGLMPVHGRVVFSAQAKAGKTTVRDNVLRSLADGEPFLGRFAVTPPQGRILLLDAELSEPMLRGWLRDQDISNTDRVAVMSLRGRVSSFNLMDPACRNGWAKVCQDLEVALVVLDCLRPVLDALRLSEDKDAGAFFVALDAMLLAGGVAEALVVHHMGHEGGRARGDTRIRDWPDAEWSLHKGSQGRRSFWAVGRDVELERTQLEFEPARRRLTAAAGATQPLLQPGPDWEELIVAALRDAPGFSGRALEQLVCPSGAGRNAFRAALNDLEVRGVVVNLGDRRSAAWHLMS